MTKGELMEISDESLGRLMLQVRAEFERRQIAFDLVQVHPGNAVDGRPMPLVARIITKLVKLPPADVAKVEALVDGFTRAAADPPA